MQNWRVYSKKADFDSIAGKFGIDKVTARIIRNRDVEGDEAISMFLNGRTDDLYDPFLMKNLDNAVETVCNAICEGKKIRIIGDYDIDGICSIYILYKGLKALSANVDYEIPDRIADGYGINERLIDDCKKDGVKLILTCDNGIAAFSQIEYAKKLGMTVVVTDHHDIPFEMDGENKKYILPPADVVVDPKVCDEEYPFNNLCGAGVAYKFIQLLHESEGLEFDTDKDFLSIAAIATIGDVVDLLDENRIIVKEGLKVLRNTTNPGLNALIEQRNLDKSKLTSYSIGFIIGPCLNASGRLDTAKKALKMLLCTEEEQAKEAALELSSLNDERKEITLSATQKATELIEGTQLSEDKVLVVFLPDCHESVAGIVAGRIREKYYKPTIVLTRGAKGVKGSARSIETYNMYEELTKCKDLLTKFGGHPMAAGMSLLEENVDKFRKALNENCTLSEDDLTEKVWIDVPMPISYIKEELIYDLQKLEPFGKGNEKPTFADRNLLITDYRSMGKDGQYARMTLMNNESIRINAVCFSECEMLKKAYMDNKRISVTYYPEVNEYMGRKSLQITVTRYRIEE